MNTVIAKPIKFPNHGVLTAQIPDNILLEIKKEIDIISKNRAGSKPFNDELVGQIADEYDLSNCKQLLKDYVNELAAAYSEQFTPLYLKSRANVVQGSYILELDKLWVNFQKKHEFNPPHNHSGAFSFVIWIKIPYNLANEFKLANSKNSNQPLNSVFFMQYSDVLGKIHSFPLPIDSEYEGTILFFPSELLHGVNPFYTSDEERISVSGNLFVRQI